MIPEVYVDGIGRIGFVDGMVRIELISRSGNETDEQGKPKPEVRQRLILSLNGFLQALQSMQGVIPKLQEVGVLRAEPPAGQAPAPAASSNGAAPVLPKSPNFTA